MLNSRISPKYAKSAKTVKPRGQHDRSPSIYKNSKKLQTKKHVKSSKNGNDLGDLDFDLVTLRSIGDHDLVHTYL